MGPEMCEARALGAVLYVRGLLPNKATPTLVPSTQLVTKTPGSEEEQGSCKQTNWRTQCNGFYRQHGNDKIGFARYTQIDHPMLPGFSGGYIVWDEENGRWVIGNDGYLLSAAKPGFFASLFGGDQKPPSHGWASKGPGFPKLPTPKADGGPVEDVEVEWL